MDFALDAEQAMLQQVVRDFLAAKSPESAVRAQMADVVGYNEKLWRQMADQIGLQGLAIPEEFGGGGFTFVELGIAARGTGPCVGGDAVPRVSCDGAATAVGAGRWRR